MAFDVTSLLDEAKNGARPSLFVAQIDFPTVDGASAKIQSVAMTALSRFLIKSTSLPASNLGIIEMPFMGRKIKIAGDRTFDDWETTIIADDQLLLRAELENWHNAINGYKSNKTGFNTLLQYRASAKVIQLNQSGNAVRQYEFTNLWPSVIGSMELGWETTDTIGEYSVTWTYDYFVAGGSLSETVESFAAELGTKLVDLGIDALIP